jgi:hypothetical protein
VDPLADEDPLITSAVDRRRELDASLRPGVAPDDWPKWMELVMVVNTNHHAGTAGVVDTALYVSLNRFLATVKAPEEVVTAVAVLRALTAWDFAAAARESERLLSSPAAFTLIPIDYLRDGAVVSNLKIGDVEAAKRIFDMTLPVMARDAAGVLRTRLLGAQIAIAMRDRQQSSPLP